MSGRALVAALAPLVCACSGTIGTLGVELTTAPGSHVLDAVDTLQLTLTRPRQVITAQRTAAGFDLALEVDASGVGGALIVEGFDAQGALVACGQSPAFSVSAINADITVYVAAPRSFAVAPVAFRAAHSELSGALLAYGVVLAGGRDAAGSPSTTIAIYDAYHHTLVEGVALPAARTGLAMAAGGAGGVYLFGGTGADGTPAGTLWRFDTTVAPNGSYSTVSEQAALARTDQLLVPLGAERFLITGSPPLTLDRGVLTARTDIAALPPVGASVASADGNGTAVFADAQLVRYSDGAFDTLGSARPAAGATTLPDGRIAIVGGGEPTLSRDALVVDPATGAMTTIHDALSTPRSHPSLAATSRHLVVVGGTDMAGAPIATADVLDVVTLAPIATLPIAARTATFAAALPNDQVLLVGGTPASEQIELFTPEPPAR